MSMKVVENGGVDWDVVKSFSDRLPDNWEPLSVDEWNKMMKEVDHLPEVTQGYVFEMIFLHKPSGVEI